MSDEYEGVLARNYDALYGVMRDPSGDAAFYRALARGDGGPVLELGCGTGRVLLPIAALGIPCVGVDASPAMLAVLRAKNPPPNLELVEARMETFDLGGAPVPAGDVPVPRLPAPAGRGQPARGARQRPQAPGARRRVRVRHLRPEAGVARRARRRPSASTRRSRSTASRSAGSPDVRTRSGDADHGGHVPLRAGRRTDGNTTVSPALVLPLRDRAPARARRLHRRHHLRRLRPAALAPEGETVIVARAP